MPIEDTWSLMVRIILESKKLFNHLKTETIQMNTMSGKSLFVVFLMRSRAMVLVLEQNTRAFTVKIESLSQWIGFGFILFYFEGFFPLFYEYLI